jgi:hypothetical protein
MTARALHRSRGTLVEIVLGGVISGYILGATGLAGDILRAIIRPPAVPPAGAVAVLPSQTAASTFVEPTAAPQTGPSMVGGPTPCTPSDSIEWANHEPNFQPSIDIAIGACQVLMVSSGSMDIRGGPSCGVQVDVVCAEVMYTPMAESFLATGLGVSWYGTAQTTIEAAIADKVSDPTKGWFSPANCSGGCDEARVFILDRTGRLVEERAILRP